ncbi:imidazole glycerol phosphate synthase subunit HisH [Candidatus Gracilibacteria bacterium]|nr:imidazole glycerol phosphate synthase subunit HisH [Candidatus Gracilibacteria bacterium]
MNQIITIIDYNAGNIGSVTNALKKLAIPYVLTANAREIARAEKIIFPGVGRAETVMEELKKRNLIEVIQNSTVPFLGLCIGMQALADFSYEDNIPCLGIISGKVRRLPDNVKIPQIGWNQVSIVRETPLTEGIPNNSYFYFVNSYFFDADADNTCAETMYGIPFCAIVQKNNFYGAQFHPEKSSDVGQQLLFNFSTKC